jgi:hypothetical protein
MAVSRTGLTAVGAPRASTVGTSRARNAAGVPPSQEYMQREVQNVLEAIRGIDFALTTGHAISPAQRQSEIY